MIKENAPEGEEKVEKNFKKYFEKKILKIFF